MGATSLERHITLDRAMYGSDQAASIEPAGFRQLVGGVRKIDVGMGDGGIEMNLKKNQLPTNFELTYLHKIFLD